jgi:hypothetical protein
VGHERAALGTEPPATTIAPCLQATFAIRFNRFRHEVGHVFQGRYTAILLKDFDVLGAVCHYIHLERRDGAAGRGQTTTFVILCR